MLMHRLSSDSLRDEISALGPWFHNIRLGAIETAPDHPLGDYPSIKWRHFKPAIADKVCGRSVLDIGCNAGFYSIEIKRLGAARVCGIDFDDRYASDPTNWWVPNRACTEAMLRSSGFDLLDHPEDEVYVCRKRPLPQCLAVYPARSAR
jgi:SAM-dependent methyltransferase